jgi:hypothetical protein
MAQPAPVTTDRLPWLTEVPSTPAPEKKRRRFRWEWLVAGLLLVLAGAGAYWLLNRVNGAAEPPPVIEDVTESVPDGIDEIPSVSDMTDSNLLSIEPVEAPPESTTEQMQPAERQVRRERVRRARPRADSATAETASSSEVNIPDQPIVRGRIIQIGAYPTKAEADVAWKYVVKKWPYLASKPKLVSPIEVSSTDGTATRMYRLQLATTSQAQSAVICQRLESAKVSCVVVY